MSTQRRDAAHGFKCVCLHVYLCVYLCEDQFESFYFSWLVDRLLKKGYTITLIISQIWTKFGLNLLDLPPPPLPPEHVKLSHLSEKQNIFLVINSNLALYNQIYLLYIQYMYHASQL